MKKINIFIVFGLISVSYAIGPAQTAVHNVQPQQQMAIVPYVSLPPLVDLSSAIITPCSAISDDLVQISLRYAPKDIQLLMKYFDIINNKENADDMSEYFDAFLLTGASGTGKNLLAECLAQKYTASGNIIKHVCISCPFLVRTNTYAQHGIQVLFFLLEHILRRDTHNIIILDSIDAILRKYRSCWRSIFSHIVATVRGHNAKNIIIGTINTDCLDERMNELFDWQINLNLPSFAMRKELISYHIRKRRLICSDAIVNDLVKKTDTFSLFCIENLIKNIALRTHCSKDGGDVIIPKIAQEALKQEYKRLSLLGEQRLHCSNTLASLMKDNRQEMYILALFAFIIIILSRSYAFSSIVCSAT